MDSTVVPSHHSKEGANPPGWPYRSADTKKRCAGASQAAQRAVDTATARARSLAALPLSAEQQDASDALFRDCLYGSDYGWNFGFQAGAGCGKSFTAAHRSGFLSRLIDHGFRVGMAAPTHIACGVSREYLLESGIDIEPRTLHSILGMKEVKRGGERTFVPSGNSSLHLYDVLLVDESSMVSPLLFEEAQKQRKDQVFIWMGDPHQLPPVTEGESDFKISPALDPSQLTKIYRLEETHRFGGPLLEKATRLRTDPNEWKACWEASGDSIRTVADEFDLKDAFGEQLKAGDGSVRMLAFTNRCVDRWNRIAHLRLYGAGAPKYLEGMKLLTRDAIKPQALGLLDPRAQSQNMLWGTSYELEILAVEKTQTWLVEHSDNVPPFETWLIKAFSPFSYREEWVQVLHASEEGRYKGYLKMIAEAAKKEKNKNRQKELWRMFWAWKESFADVQPAYCSTVHRAQGQGIDHIFLQTADLKKPGQKSPEMAQALLYTAATRARKTITTVGV